MKQPRKARLQYARLAAQIAGMIAAVIGYFAAIRSLGLPKWAYFGSIAVAGLFFCGWLCPFGTAQEWLRALGKNVLGLSLNIPARINRYLLFSRYLFALFGATAAFSFLDSRRAFITTLTGNIAVGGALAMLGLTLLLSLAVDRPYCRYVCAFGAMAGAISMARLVGVRRDADKCAGCGKCDKSCMMGVEVSCAHNVRDPNCINCGKCLTACPVPGALAAGATLPCRADLAALRDKYRTPDDRAA